MMSRSLMTVGLLLAFALGLAMDSLVSNSPAIAQSAPANTVGRYQVSAYGSVSQATNSLKQGCFIIDTVTGTLLHMQLGDTGPQKVLDKLP